MIEDKETKKTEDRPEDKEYLGTRKELKRIRKELRRQRKARRPGKHYIFWGLMFILWGVLLFLLEQEWLPSSDLWKAFLIGLGSIFIIQAFTYLLNPEYRPQAVGRFVPGIILLLIGLQFLFGFNAWWPVALIVAGVAVLLISWFLQREIQTRKVTQEILHESETKYRYIIDNANSIIMETDTRGNITFVNKFALDFFGFQENEILNHNMVGTIVPPAASDNESQEKMIQDIAMSPGKYLHHESENLRKNGEKAWIIWSYKPIFDEANNLKEILYIGIDNTQQKKAGELASLQLKERTALEERNRLARDLHDAVSQTLFSASLIAEVLPKVWERNKDEGLKKLEEVRQLTRGALAEMRTLLFELRPAALADADLNDLLKQLTESVIGKTRIPVSLEIDGTNELPTSVKVALYRITQEALNNITKHSKASRAQVTLHSQPHRVTLQIIDNGRGFDMAQGATGSFGLNNMRERAGQIGAVLQIDSKLGQGTEITVDWHNNTGEGLQ